MTAPTRTDRRRSVAKRMSHRRSRTGGRGGETVVALSTAGSRDEAERLATTLVDERLAACVNLVAPLTSIYRWQGVVERAEETLLVIKTRRALVPRLTARVRELHSYDVPELIVLPIVAGAAPYLAMAAVLLVVGYVTTPSVTRVAVAVGGVLVLVATEGASGTISLVLLAALLLWLLGATRGWFG